MRRPPEARAHPRSRGDRERIRIWQLYPSNARYFSLPRTLSGRLTPLTQAARSGLAPSAAVTNRSQTSLHVLTLLLVLRPNNHAVARDDHRPSQTVPTHGGVHASTTTSGRPRRPPRARRAPNHRLHRPHRRRPFLLRRRRRQGFLNIPGPGNLSQCRREESSVHAKIRPRCVILILMQVLKTSYNTYASARNDALHHRP